MYQAANAYDDFDDDIPTQYVIQQSLQDVPKSEMVTTAEDDRFHFATSANHRKIITAIRTEQDGHGCLPLHEAAAQLNKRILEITLKASDPTVWQQTNVKGETPLFVAVDKCLVGNVHFLLLNGFNPDIKNEDGDSPLFIAVQRDSYEIASFLIQFGAKVNLQCVNKRTALHEAAKLGRKGMVEFLLWSKADPDPRSSYGLTPLALAAQNGHTEILEILLRKGSHSMVTVLPQKGPGLLKSGMKDGTENGPLVVECNCHWKVYKEKWFCEYKSQAMKSFEGANVLSQASDSASILFEAAGGGNPDSVSLLLEYGADANVPKHSGHLPIHRAAHRGHLLVLQILVPVTDYSAIKESGISPVHSAAAGGHPQCLEFLLKYGFDANFMLHQRVRKGYHDERKSALYFAVSNGDITSARLLLEAGALPNQDPVNCLQVALRMGNYELVSLLLRHGANVNYYCRVNTTHFPSALQYTLKDEVMLRMLLNYGYDVDRCFDCAHGDKHSQYMFEGWTSTVIKDNMFCEVITVAWLKHLSGKIVHVMLDYVDHIRLCPKLQGVLQEQKLWPEINAILTNVRPLKHLCRLKIRKCLGRLRLRCPVFLTFLPLPNRLKEYILYKEYDLYGQGSLKGNF